MPNFDPVDARQSFPALEHGILQYWKEESIFQRSLEQRQGAERYSFFDGPPFATGLPHYGHLLAGTIKDVMPRYQTMRGKYVERRFGWDCHGLPIENIIEKEHNIAGKPDIEKMGVATFNQLCRSAVQRYVGEWRKTVERSGRWVDMDNDYRTMDASYMEGIWWVLGELSKKKLLYEGYKPMYVCPRCATPLSNFEVSDGYKERTDQSVIMTFPLVDDPNTVLLAWTTTPWSLPGNFWLAVGPDITYATVKHEGKTYVLAQNLVEKVFAQKEYEITGTIAAKKLVGQRYVPLFPYFVDTPLQSTVDTKKPQTYGERVFKVIINPAVTVSDQEGTGIVHLTSCTGEDSFAVATTEKVDPLPHLGIDGVFIEAVTDFRGLNAKPQGEDPMATDKAIIAWLKAHGRAFASYTINHSYPHCWRCDTPLLPFVTSSWFVAVEKIKEAMLQSNSETEWVPAHLRDGRFGKWLENARDWAISRNRYWGTPLPIWCSDKTGDLEVIANRDELIAKQKIRFTKVSLVRHAESEGNLQGLYQSQLPGTSLTSNGKKMAKEAAAYLKDQAPDVIYCSPLARCQETAAAIAAASGATVITDERLREVDCGPVEGKTWKELMEPDGRRAQVIRQAAEATPQPSHHAPGMELLESVQTRVSDFLDEMLPRHRGEHVVVVTHADPILCARHHFTGENHRKLVAQPKPAFAAPEALYWDHTTDQQLDLHKDIVDLLVWPGPNHETEVTLTLVRHGETDHNEQGIVQGHADRSLNDKGRQQAADVAKTLKKEHYDVIISSDLSRAKETAAVISETLGLPISETLPLFRERMMGDWQGRSKQEFADKHISNPCLTIYTPENGESFAAFAARAQEAYRYLLKTYPGKRVLLVAHGGFMSAFSAFVENLSHAEMSALKVPNLATKTYQLTPFMRRTTEVLDCWFESGSMPYAQSGFPNRYGSATKRGSQLAPHGFPADFIAEGIDQTRGWFYTLTVLGSAIFGESPFRHCIVNGTVLAEDGRKMSKKLKNYPDPLELVEKYGADALRFTLMNSPAVRAEDMRFSERSVEESLRAVLLPLWNSYSFFVTYANEANFEAVDGRRASSHPLDQWITAEMQDLTNRMTAQLEAYDLSATCAELNDTIDALTNWYIRLSRRRFAGKGDLEQPMGDPEQERADALQTLHGVLITLCQLLAPFCPFVTEAIYVNLVRAPHGSIHLTDWPTTRELTKADTALLTKTRLLRTVVSLGLKLRNDAKVRVRQPLQSITIALPPDRQAFIGKDETVLIRQELNVKEVILTKDPGSLGQPVAMVNARKVGPRLGGRVQEVIGAGKKGDFTIEDDGTVLIMEERLSPDEVTIAYQAREGKAVAADKGIVAGLDTQVTPELEKEGLLRDAIRAVQQLRKDSGLSVADRIALQIDGLGDLSKDEAALIERETGATIGQSTGTPQSIDLEGTPVTVSLHKL